MTQENNKQYQENNEKSVVSNMENSADLKTSGAQNSQNQTAGSATAVKKYNETAKSGETSSTGVIKDFYDKAKQSAGQVTEKAAEKLDEKKSVVTDGLSGVADSIRQVGENLRGTEDEENPIAQLTGKYGDVLASQVESISDYFDRKNVREIVRDVEGYARRNPAVFIGGAFALGILAARFLKSSSPKQLSKGQGRSFNSDYSSDESYSNGESKTASNPS
ncbi:hypothetical protein BH10ACI1_BH10ACI1_14540 [soil metagenome]